jgi:hypothetical protein
MLALVIGGDKFDCRVWIGTLPFRSPPQIESYCAQSVRRPPGGRQQFWLEPRGDGGRLGILELQYKGAFYLGMDTHQCRVPE